MLLQFELPQFLSSLGFFFYYTAKFNSLGFYSIINWNKRSIKAQTDSCIISEYPITVCLQICSNGVPKCIHAYSLNLQKRKKMTFLFPLGTNWSTLPCIQCWRMFLDNYCVLADNMNPDLMLSENKQHTGKSISDSKTRMSCNFLKQKCSSACPLRGESLH